MGDNNWRNTTLGEIADQSGYGLVDGPFGSNLPASSYTEHGVPVIRGTNLSIGSDRFKENDFVYVSEETAQKLERSLCRVGDIVFTKKGTLGQTGFIDENSRFPKYLLSSNQMKLTVNKTIADPLFVYYFVSSPQSILKIKRDSEETGVPKTNVTYLKDFPINLPPLPEQKRIAHILGTLDDKIDNNRRMNATLEAMAQALFKSWFVDFDPVIDNALTAGNPIPEALAHRAELRKTVLAQSTGSRGAPAPQNNNDGAGAPSLPVSPLAHTNPDIANLFPATFQETEDLGPIPEGWGSATVGDYLEIKRGGSPRPIKDYIQSEGLPWVKIADATSSTNRFLFSTKECIKPEGLKKTIMKSKGSLILSNSATPGLPIFLELDACIHDGWLHFPSIKHFTQTYMYQQFLIIREELVGKGNGSVFTNLKTDILRSQSIVVPLKNILNKYNDYSKVNHGKIHQIATQTNELTKLRDTLLPKLISSHS